MEPKKDELRVNAAIEWMSREGLDFGEIHMSGQACIEEVHQAFNDLLYTARQKYGTPDPFRALDYLESRANQEGGDDYRPPTWEEDQQQQRRANLADELFPDSAKEQK
jgi:hypothetical protein